MGYKTTDSNAKEESPYPIKTVEVTDAEMAQLKIDYLAASDLIPYVVCNIEDPNNKSYFQWTGSDWINWINSVVQNSICISNNATLSPLEIIINQDDYNPAGLTDGSGNYIKTFLRLDASSGNVDITGLQEPNQNCNVIIYALNVGTSDIKFKNNDGSSLANNRFLFQPGEIKIKENEAATFIYDKIVNRWKNISKH